MKMTGHKTDRVFRRYDIVSPDDLRIAAERLDAATARSVTFVNIADVRAPRASATH